MKISIANNALSSCKTIEQVAELINDDFATDATAEMVAAAYAIEDISSMEGELIGEGTWYPCDKNGEF